MKPVTCDRIGKAPLDSCFGTIAFGLPGLNFGLQGFFVGYAAVQALAGQD